MARACAAAAPCSSACGGPGSAVKPNFWAAEAPASPACVAGLMTGALAALLTMTVASSSSSCGGEAPPPPRRPAARR